MTTVPVPRRYAPRTRIAPAAVSLINGLARPWGGFTGAVEGLDLILAPAGVSLGGVAPSEGETGIVVGVGAGDRLILRLPSAIPDRIARAVQADLDALPPGPAGLFLLELALAPLLDAAERITGRHARIEAMTSAASPPGTVTLLLDGRLGDDAFTATLDLLPSGVAAEAVLALMRVPARPGMPPAEIGLTLAWEAGATRLDAGRIAGLRPGDVVLPDLWHPAQREIRVLLGTTHAALAVWDAPGVKLKTALRPIPAGSPGNGTDVMGQETTNDAAGPWLDAVGLTLTFELGRRSITLAELKGVGAGHVFDLGLSPDDPVDLVVNGSRIGRGEIITVGERLGIRVVRLFGHERGA